MQLTKNMALFSIAAIGYYLIGYNLMYPLGDWSIDGVFSALFPAVAVMEAVGVAPEAADDLAMPRQHPLFFPADVLCGDGVVVSGALAERIKLWPSCCSHLF